VAQEIFLGSGLFQAVCVFTPKLQLSGYLPLQAYPFLFLTDHHDILMRTRILTSFDHPISCTLQRQQCAARSILARKARNYILDEGTLSFQDVQNEFEWFLHEAYPIWDAITEHKEWSKEKVRIARGIISSVRDVICDKQYRTSK